jgi:outer membrane protein
MRHSYWLLAAGIAAGVPSRAIAQTVLPLDRAVQEAVARNPAVAAARAGADESREAADGARAGFFPRVSFGESWQRADQPVFVFSSLLSARHFAAPNFAIDALNHPDAIGFFHANFGVEQIVFDGGRTRAAVRSAAARRDAAADAASQTAADIALAVTQAYGRVLSAQTGRRAADAAVAAAQEDLGRAEHRRDVGTATDADVLGLAVHVAAMKQRSVEATGEDAIARAELNRVLGAAIDREFAVAEPPAPAAASGGDVRALVAQAMESRAEIHRADAAVRAADAGVAGARASWLPQIAAQAGYELSGTRFADRASAWLVGGELRWTVSAGGAEAAQVRAAHAALERARAEQAAARAAVDVEVVTAVRRLESAGARAALGTAAVEQARESQRIIRDRFEAGLVGVGDVLRAATTVLDAESQRTAAVVDAVVSDAMLRRAIGRTP